MLIDIADLDTRVILCTSHVDMQKSSQSTIGKYHGTRTHCTTVACHQPHMELLTPVTTEAPHIVSCGTG